VLNLTLVDLPGITKVPTGDQPEDVEEQIRAMCYEFISNPNAVILAVTAANQDLANSDGLKMARSVDPDGERTIGVLTKVDIMDHGTDCADVLNNKVIPLRRGHIAIVNRSQKDVQDGVPIRKGLAKEANFFQSHPKYRTMLEKCGTPNLSRTLNQILLHHIRDCLPEIKSRIGKMLSSVQMNLDSLGESIDEQSAQYKGGIILRMMSKFAENFGNKVDGKSSTELSTEMTELYGGARINYIFNEIFGKLLRSVDPFDGLEDEDIRTAIANANGTRPSLFVPEISFDLLVRRQIARLEQPGLHCVELILEEMQTMVRQSETLELARFPDLKDRALEIVDKLLRDCVSPAQKMISNLIQIELAYINTSHPDFIGGKQAAANAAAQARKQPPPAPMQQQQQQLNNNDGSHRTGSIDLTNAESSAKQLQPPVTPMVPNNGASSQEGRGFFGLFQAPTGGGGSNNNSGKAMGNNAQSTALVGPASKQHFHSGGGNVSSSSGGGGYRGDDLKIIRLPQVPEKMRCMTAFSDKDRMEIEIIKNLIGSYFDIVKVRRLLRCLMYCSDCDFCCLFLIIRKTSPIWCQSPSCISWW
jgi:dynamin 1-like protein